jgi:hypothetical protein
MSLPTVTRGQFEEATKKYPPNGFTKFIFRFFSSDVKGKDIKVGKIISYFLLSLFVIGWAGTVIQEEARVDWPHKIIAIVTLTYAFILVPLVLTISVAYFMNNHRIKKIAKELGIDVLTYNSYVEMYK